ncbi:uncharacterized protein IL334_005920 [Kwoniella shivajii]|uniref:FAM192A/Fyv6 N-terminal domain-containing protein n=1 Tax=Kwoniella shivajii TaxID=564305 RepID=A0ABZ1D551_9TREE|nr:hypothetical protein IL334_005920 [Kwoniella shivajii]
MDPSQILTPATGSITSRFESQTSIDEAKENRQKQWREAYARIGQEPPAEQPDEEYDPRTLYERLQAKKDVKKEEWDNKMKLSNQWRGLDSEEQMFLREKEAEKRAEQRKVEDKEAEELREYRERLAAKHSTPIDPIPSSSSTSTASSQTKKVPPKPARKDVKSLMKGIVVKKKPKPSTSTTPSAKNMTPQTSISTSATKESPSAIPTSTNEKPILGNKRDASSEIWSSDEMKDQEDKRRKLNEEKV